MMGTRCGDVDPGALAYLMKCNNLDADGFLKLINKESGVLGLSGISSDMRDIEDAIEKGDERAILAMDMYEYRILKYVGQYLAALGGADIIVFTGGVGENQTVTRQHIMEQLQFMGVTLNLEANKTRGKEIVVSGDDSKIKVVVIPTDEELMIAKDTDAIVNNL